MAKYKVLNSVAHNFAQSFVSLMNHQFDYFMSFLLRRVKETGYNHLKVDLISMQITPKELVTPEIKSCIDVYFRLFPDFINGVGSSVKYIKGAVVEVIFHPEVTIQAPLTKRTMCMFECKMTITDERGKIYLHEMKDYWEDD